ncbi:DUF1295-domain-containing protein [Trametes polyzona]|nr:DUF1295-domain-containing protein [Trametes polyzona]
MGHPTHVLDRYYLAITFLVTVGCQFTGFAIAWTFQFDKITDFTGGLNFLNLALLTLLLGQEFSARNIITSLFVMLWAVRLGGFLLFRVLMTGRDTRFDEIRSNFLKFLGFWVGQIVWVWLVSIPVTVLNSPAVTERGQPAFGTASDILGIIIWVFGVVIESVSDAQKYVWRNHGGPKDRHIDIGLWGWSRHPSYFGEILCWWGIWCLSIAPSLHTGHGDSSTRSAQLAGLVSPLFTMVLLLFASGVPTAEVPVAQKFYKMSYPDPDSDVEQPSPDRDATTATATATGARESGRAPANDAWANYRRYRAQTSVLVPLPPALYRALPVWVKRTVLLELPMYEWTPGPEGGAKV